LGKEELRQDAHVRFDGHHASRRRRRPFLGRRRKQRVEPRQSQRYSGAAQEGPTIDRGTVGRKRRMHMAIPPFEQGASYHIGRRTSRGIDAASANKRSPPDPWLDQLQAELFQFGSRGPLCCPWAGSLRSSARRELIRQRGCFTARLGGQLA